MTTTKTTPEQKTTIQTKTTTIKAKTTTAILNKDKPQLAIVNSKNSKELTTPAINLSLLKAEFSDKEKAFKAALKVEEAKVKAIKNEIAELEAYLKERALKVVNVELKQKQTIKGQLKVKVEHNLNTSLFSYTPAKTQAIVNTKEILANPTKYKKFVKEVKTFEIDWEALEKAPAEEKPWVEDDREAKVSFKKITPTKAKELLNELK